MDQVTLAKFVECFPFLHHEHLPGQMLDCETLYYIWLVVLETKRGTIRPTTLCKEGLTWECTIAILVLVGWSVLDLAAIQEGGDGRDGLLLD